KVVEDLSPRGVGVCTTAVTLVDDDEVEEPRRELLVELLPLLRPRDRLVQAEVDLVRLVDPPRGINADRDRRRSVVDGLDGLRPRAELRHSVLEGTEIVDHCLVD